MGRGAGGCLWRGYLHAGGSVVGGVAVGGSEGCLAGGMDGVCGWW